MHRFWKHIALALSFAGAAACSSGGGPAGTPDAAAPADDGGGDLGPDVPGDRAGGDAAVDQPPTGASRAGAACTGDTGCGPTLRCDTEFPGGFCTAECTDNASQAREQAECGGAGSTCLTIGDGEEATSSCTSTCTPTARAGMPGTCRAGLVCTGWWYTHETGDPDRTGCEYFCQSDAQCTGGARCNPRVGECGDTGLVMTRRADGEPCDPSMTSGDPPANTQCRGICFQETDSPRQGICGSLVNLGASGDCPDNPTRIRALAPSNENGRRDNLGLCIYRECSTDADCTAPLRCVAGEDGDPSVCTYPEGPAADGGAPDAARDASADAPSDAPAPTDAVPTDAARDAAAG